MTHFKRPPSKRSELASILAGTAQKEDIQTDPKVAALLHKLSHRPSLTAEEVSSLINAPAAVLAATLRSERRKMAAVLQAVVSEEIVALTRRYQRLLNRALYELEKRPLHEMTTSQLLGIVQQTGRWLGQINAAAVLRPPTERIDDSDKAPLTNQAVNVLIQDIHRTGKKAKLAKQKEVKPLEIAESKPCKPGNPPSRPDRHPSRKDASQQDTSI